MPEVTTVSEEGFGSESLIRDFSIDVDPTGEAAPDTLELLLADYAACFTPALRVGAEQRNVGDLGRIEITATGELNDDDKLDSVAFDIKVEADITGDQGDQTLERAFELCKVHDAVKPSLYADATITGGH